MLRTARIGAGRSTTPRRLEVLFAAGLLFALALLVPARATALTTSQTTLARGVTYWRQTFTPAGGGTARAVLLHIDLTVATLRMAPASPGEMIGAPLRPLSYMGNATHAVAGVNGDFFHDDGTPYGGMVRSGALLKSPRPSGNANFYIAANGAAAIGAVPLSARVARPAVGARAATAHAVRSVNNLRDAEAGAITYVTRALAVITLGSRCTAAIGHTANGVSVVTSVETGARTIARRPIGGWALIACNSTAASWIRTALRANDKVVISTSFPNGRPRALIAGGGTLVRRGVAYYDRTRIAPSGRNPETFACVDRTGRSVLLGVIDGRSRASTGVSLHELTLYLLGRHCYSGMYFDGGGSTEMVARLPGHSTVSVLNVPSDGDQRSIPNGLFVYRV